MSTRITHNFSTREKKRKIEKFTTESEKKKKERKEKKRKDTVIEQ